MTADNGLVRYVDTTADDLIGSLRAENRQLKADLADAQRAVEHARANAARSVAALRKQLQPLYRALQGVFGELDDLAPNDDQSAPRSGAWDEWKARLGPSCAKVIDVLLLGGEMTVTAIMTTGKMGKNTVYQATSKMGQAGILVRNGSKFSLKQL
jgi:hypothetical protein